MAAGYTFGRANDVCCEHDGKWSCLQRNSSLSMKHMAWARVETALLELWLIFSSFLYILIFTLITVWSLWILLGIFVYPERLLPWAAGVVGVVGYVVFLYSKLCELQNEIFEQLKGALNKALRELNSLNGAAVLGLEVGEEQTLAAAGGGMMGTLMGASNPIKAQINLRRALMAAKTAEAKEQAVLEAVQKAVFACDLKGLQEFVLPLVKEELGDTAAPVVFVQEVVEVVTVLHKAGTEAMVQIEMAQRAAAEELKEATQGLVTKLPVSMEEARTAAESIIKMEEYRGPGLLKELTGLDGIPTTTDELATMLTTLMEKTSTNNATDCCPSLDKVCTEIMAVADTAIASLESLPETKDLVEAMKQTREFAKLACEVQREAVQLMQALQAAAEKGVADRMGPSATDAMNKAIDDTRSSHLFTTMEREGDQAVDQAVALLERALKWAEDAVEVVTKLQAASKNQDVVGVKARTDEASRIFGNQHPLVQMSREVLKESIRTCRTQAMLAEVRADDVRSIMIKNGFTPSVIISAVIGSAIMLILVLAFLYLGYIVLVVEINWTNAIVASVSVLTSCMSVGRFRAPPSDTSRMVDRIVAYLVDQWKKKQGQQDTDNFMFDDEAHAVDTLNRAVLFHKNKLRK